MAPMNKILDQLSVGLVVIATLQIQGTPIQMKIKFAHHLY